MPPSTRSMQSKQLNRRKVMSLIMAAAASPAIVVSRASALTYPDRPIRMIVPFGAGGQADLTIRFVAQRMSAVLNQPIVIENRSGGGGSIGTLAAAQAEPDGYTLLAASSSTHSIMPALAEKLSYDPIKQFSPIAKVSTAPFILAVNTKIPATNVAELVAFSKENPGKLNFGAATATPPHILAFVLRTLSGVDFGVALYRGGGAAMADLTANHVQAIFQTPTTIMPMADDQRIRVLGIASERRFKILPATPTLVEQGLSDMVANSWNGLCAPVGTPTPIIERLSQVANDVLSTPEAEDRYRKLGLERNISNPEEFAAFISKETEHWHKLVGISKIDKLR